MQIQTSLEKEAKNSLGSQITIARGDGIGPEIMEATLRILDAAGAGLHYNEIVIGQEVYKEGILSGIQEADWDLLKSNQVFLKAPIMTPQGQGFKSLNVTIRKTLGLAVNVRPSRSFSPYIKSFFPDLDLVIIRENEEDLYAGIEHQQTNEVVQCLKLITRPGCEKIIRYAFEFARAQGRSKVTCMSKDNIMKQTDGLFHQVFQEIGAEYPEIQQEHLIIDIGSAKLASNPEQFDVIVTLNLYGDILSDIAAQISGSVGLSGSANIGTDFAMFEAVHGSAPDIAGQNLANPSGLIQAACMMLTHLGKTETADLIQKALLYTLEEGIHTGDIYDPSFSKVRVGTREFTEAVIHHLGKSPRHLKVIQPGASLSNWMVSAPNSAPREAKKELVGIDVFLDWSEAERDPDALGKILEASEIYNLKLKMITNRGVKVYPQGHPETFCTDHWRCRFVSRQSKVSKDGAAMYDTYPVSYLDIIDLLRNLYQKGLEVIKTENLYLIDGKRAYSLGQGE